MKKNKMMRIASVLLVMTLISTCAISGTFAKYVTKVSGEDEARVAKWGITLTMKGSAFDTKYKTDDSTYTPAYADTDNTYTVLSANTEKVVAPGTGSDNQYNNTDTLVATIAGKPEVAVRYALELKDIVVPMLKAGTYKDYTELKKNDNGEYAYEDFTLEEDYYPIVFTLKIEAAGKTGSLTFKDEKSLQDALSGIGQLGGLVKVEGSKIYVDFSPNTDVTGTFTLSWKWAFEQNDKADTFLGNEETAQKVSFNFTATATQID